MTLSRRLVTIFILFFGIISEGSVLSDEFRFAFRDSSKYLDIRLDADNDGLIEIWLVQDENIQIKYYNKRNEQYAHVRSLRFPRTNILISRRDGIQRIHRWNENAKTIFNFTQTLCAEEKTKTSAIDEIASFADNLDEFAYDEVIISLVDSSCDSKINMESLPYIQNSIALLLNNSKDGLIACLESSKNSRLPESLKNETQLARAKAQLQSKNYLNSQENIEPLIFCEDIKDKSAKNGKFSGGFAFYSDGKIHLGSDSTGKISLKSNEEAKKVLLHEYLHHLGIEDEDSAELITAHCSKEDVSSLKITSSVAGNQSLALASANKAQEIVASSNQGISKAAAETVKSIPSSPNVAPAQMAQIHKAAGASGVEAVSRSQTSGMLASANNLMGLMGTRATAATKSTGSSTRAPSSSGAITKYKSDSLVTTKSRLKSKAGKAQAGETMVEEYVLGQGSKTSAKRRPSVRQGSPESASRQPANTTNEQPTTAPTATVAPPRRQGGAEMAQAGAGGNSAGISSLPSSSGSASRRPANASPRTSSGSAADNTSTEEYVTYFTQNNYTEVKQKLRDSEFVEKLREASITVLDLRGTVYGAEKGNVILLDRGDRFVPQR